MTDAHHTTLQQTDALTSTLYRAVRVLCVQPSGATLLVCQDRTNGEQVVVKQTNKTFPGGDNDGIHEAIEVVHARGQAPVVVTRFQDSFEQERLVAHMLQAHPHNNVVRCLSSPPSLANDTLVMEYCPGGDLFSLLEDHPNRYFDEANALAHFRGIVDGVAHLHALDIAHRDLSLENVLLDAHGHAKICDFGLSARASVPAHECVGKLQYMAPEVASGTHSYGPIVADVWSLGIVLFIMLTGSPLFEFATPSDAAWGAVQRVGISGILKSWRIRDRISDETVALLSDMLRTDPAQRLQSMDDVQLRLC